MSYQHFEPHVNNLPTISKAMVGSIMPIDYNDACRFILAEKMIKIEIFVSEVTNRCPCLAVSSWSWHARSVMNEPTFGLFLLPASS